MSLVKRLTRRFFSAAAIATCLLTGTTITVMAQGLPGLTIFSGVDDGYELGYRLDNQGRSNRFDRYRLRIPPEKMEFAVSRFSITYPDNYRINFNIDNVDIEVKVDGEEVVIDEANWDVDNRVIDIYPQAEVPANSSVEVILDNIRNPRAGFYYFNALIYSPGDLPLGRYVGTWILNLGG
ncbi:MAG: DUF2808 domain-containing protein [Synechococcales cyanobacterium K44_A2020_017]|jgi:hypothetical protein|uniref:DUF2808 domain-containing protein n=1 Tax=Leptolyngbya sp. CCY15150 TaxID=2767772 RepID=UPI0019502A1E|nr:DUF2808 domain-containing protein [Leptolyngbya sp. CCY15150]MBF2090032.1 DUF2808 domain-containing protein [Synechococcales cyanobacterium K32_A2020_035]MBF2096472.1 DUF2808 domain-containing protein [Synechococcales cyanobacterium K44_A2020_017]